MENTIDLKWNKLLYRARLFTYIPFVDLVFVAGSMAMNRVKENSDFDVIVGVRSGRIFTVRVFCIFLFGLFGWRRKKGVDESGTKDKFCFNHFMAPEKYFLSGPYNEYWQKLYFSLVPIYGDKDLIQKFYDANAGWMKEKRIYQEDGRNLYFRSGYTKVFLEKILENRFGEILEGWFKKIQIKKIEKSLKSEEQYRPRIVFNDSELEFHPHTKRIEEFCDKN